MAVSNLLGMTIQRRQFLAGFGVAAAAVPFAAACSATSTESTISSLSLSDQRVQDFLKYREETRSDPAKAIKDYTTPGFVYTSSSGQKFDQAGLSSRINDWVQGFTLEKSDPLWAANLGEGRIMISTSDSLVNNGSFRGQPPSNKQFQTESLFTVAFDPEGKIESYTRFADYGALADSIGATSLSQLHGMD